MGLTIAKCPACGANLNLETDRDFFYCPHCGAKVLKHDERILIEHVIRTVDEAKVKEIEADVEKTKTEAQRQKALIPVLIGLLLLAGLLILLMFRVTSSIF